MKNKSSGKRKMSSEDTRSYFAWNLEMERVLADVLRDQRNLGNKGDGNWKAVAYSTAAQILSKLFGSVPHDYVRLLKQKLPILAFGFYYELNVSLM